MTIGVGTGSTRFPRTGCAVAGGSTSSVTRSSTSTCSFATVTWTPTASRPRCTSTRSTTIVDRASMHIVTCDATPRVLPWLECPEAAASAGRLAGMPVDGSAPGGPRASSSVRARAPISTTCCAASKTSSGWCTSSSGAPALTASVRAVRPLRSVLFARGDDRDSLEKAVASGADSIVADLEEPRTPYTEPDRERGRGVARRVLRRATGELADAAARRCCSPACSRGRPVRRSRTCARSWGRASAGS